MAERWSFHPSGDEQAEARRAIEAAVAVVSRDNPNWSRRQILVLLGWAAEVALEAEEGRGT